MVLVLSGESFIGKCFLLEAVWFGRRSSAAVGNVSFIGRDGYIFGVNTGLRTNDILHQIFAIMDYA